MHFFYKISGHPVGKLSQQEQTANMLKYIVGHLVGQPGTNDYTKTKIAYVLYLFLLEYASHYPKYQLPKRSVLRNLRFYRTDSGVGEYTFSDKHKEILDAINMCEVPTFRMVGFNQSEKKAILQSIQDARMRYLSTSEFELGCFIKHDLPLMRESPFLGPLDLSPANIKREGHAFHQKKHHLYSMKVR